MRAVVPVALREIYEGEIVPFGKLDLSRRGLTYRGKTYAPSRLRGTSTEGADLIVELDGGQSLAIPYRSIALPLAAQIVIEVLRQVTFPALSAAAPVEKNSFAF